MNDHTMLNIPVYPDFRAITLEDKSFFDAAFLKDVPLVSDLSFVSFYAWSAIEKNEFSILNDFIVVKRGASFPLEFYQPIGVGNKKEVIFQILKNSNGSFVGVSKDVADNFYADDKFLIEPQRDNFDYLYKIEDLVLLSGAKYHGKRNLIHRFKESQSYEYISFDKDSVKECLELER